MLALYHPVKELSMHGSPRTAIARREEGAGFTKLHWTLRSHQLIELCSGITDHLHGKEDTQGAKISRT